MTSISQLKASRVDYAGADTLVPATVCQGRRTPRDLWISDEVRLEWEAYEAATKESAARAVIAAERDAREPELRERLRPYGLHVLDYYAMLKEQAGKCAACGDPGDALVVDHCHLTDIVRGLIHSGCNSALGFAAESPHRLRALADYLERTR